MPSLYCASPELGIDVGAIFQKTRAVLFWRFGSRQLDDLDMGGALIFVFVLAGLQLLVGWHACGPGAVSVWAVQ